MVLCKPTNYPYRITEGWPVSRIYRFSLDIRNCGGLGVCRRQCSFTGALSALCGPGCPFTFTCIQAYCIARQAVFNIISEMIMNVVELLKENKLLYLIHANMFLLYFKVWMWLEKILLNIFNLCRLFVPGLYIIWPSRHPGYF